MTADSSWTDYDSSERTDEVLSQYSENVKEFLSSEQVQGYLLGDPTLCDGTVFQICILDPQKDLPEDIIIFANLVRDVGSPSRISKEDFSYSFNLGRYDFQLVLKKPEDAYSENFLGEFDREAKIKALRKISN